MLCSWTGTGETLTEALPFDLFGAGSRAHVHACARGMCTYTRTLALAGSILIDLFFLSSLNLKTLADVEMHFFWSSPLHTFTHSPLPPL